MGHGDRHLTRFWVNGPVPTTHEPTKTIQSSLRIQKDSIYLQLKKFSD
jgi:hypothetical protein